MSFYSFCLEFCLDQVWTSILEYQTIQIVIIDVLSNLIIIMVTVKVVVVLLVGECVPQNMNLYGKIDINTTTSSVKPWATPPPL